MDAIDFLRAICLGCFKLDFRSVAELNLTNCLHIYCKPCSEKLMKYGCISCKNKGSVRVQSLAKLNPDYRLMFSTKVSSIVSLFI